MDKIANILIGLANLIVCGIGAYYAREMYLYPIKAAAGKTGEISMISHWKIIVFFGLAICLLISTWILIYKSSIAKHKTETTATKEKFTKWPDLYQPISVIGKTFRNEKVVLDGHSYSNCKFYNVTFVYNGTTAIQFNNNEIYGAFLSSDNPAVNGAFMWMLSFKDVINQFKLDMPPSWEPIKKLP